MPSVMKRSALRPLQKGEYRQNDDGTHSTELTITEKIGDGFSNIPSLWMSGGKIVEFSNQRAVDAAMAYEKRTGKRFPRFKSIPQAVSAAKARSNKGGAGSGSLAK